jgi:hypothetical protein
VPISADYLILGDDRRPMLFSEHQMREILQRRDQILAGGAEQRTDPPAA